MRRRVFVAALASVLAAAALAQQPYSGPRPSKKDLPYLLEASKLIPTEAVPQASSKTKGEQVLSVAGTSSSARTPIPEPIFLLSPDRLRADQLVLRKFEIKGGHRELALQTSGEQDFHLTLRKLAPDLYRIEAAEMLDPGQYALVPQGGDVIFCFDVY